MITVIAFVYKAHEKFTIGAITFERIAREVETYREKGGKICLIIY